MTAPRARILAIDDTPANLMTLGAALVDAFELQFATSGPMGIALALENPPDLILLDVMMPDVDGYETFTRLAAQPTLEDIPVIFVTALNDFDSEVTGLSLGAADFITKPINVITARHRIHNLIEREGLRKQLELQRDQLAQEIAQRIQSDDQLRKLSVAVEQSAVSVVITDLDARIEYVNLRFAEVTGYSREEALGQNPRMLQSGQTSSATYPEMWQALRSGHVWKGELINKRKNGEAYWEESQIAPVKDATGVVTHYVAVKTDITARKRVEEKLVLAANVFTHSREGITIADANGVIIDVNNSFSRITGYSREEALGQNPRILKSGKHDQAFYTAMWDSLRDESHWSGEIWNRRKSGEVFAEMLTISVVRDEHGKPREYVALFSDISERKAMEGYVHQLAFYDALTGLPNRRLLNDRLSQAMAASKRSALYGALMFLDLDNFKSLNDTHGHSVGDLLLIEVARRLNACLRDMDTVARFGGDEFVVMLSELSDNHAQSIEQARGVAEKIRSSLATPYLLAVTHDDKTHATIEHHCSASIGLVVFSNHQTSPHDVLKQADAAMYRAKAAGRNAVWLDETDVHGAGLEREVAII